MKINQLIKKICKRVQNQPGHKFFFFLDILITIINFPKYLYYLIRKQKMIAFDWGDGTYGSFYLPLFERLASSNFRIIFFFHFIKRNQFRLDILKKGLPRIYADFLDNKVVISADCTKYEQLPKTIRIQIFHGFNSFGAVWDKYFIEHFDVLFLVTKFQWKQLQMEYKDMVLGKKIFKVGYPKIDQIAQYVSTKEKNKIKRDNNITLFYGPTYHREISSIFEFLPIIVEICKKYRYKLIIKLHPALYYKENYNLSGGVDWPGRISEYQEDYPDIVFLGKNIAVYELSEYFRMADVFLTDVSGAGFEFVLATSKPIIFLGDKLKIPLEDLRKGDIKKYENYPEIYCRGKIGPIVKKPAQLEEILKRTIERDDYKIEREKFRREFVFNLGKSVDAAVSIIKRIYKAL